MAYAIANEGQKITVNCGKLAVPSKPVIPFITGDGIGKEITPVMLRVVDAAVQKAYGSKRSIAWMKVIAGEESIKKFGEPLTEEAVGTLREHIVSIKGPLGTPTGGGYKSLNVKMRKELDLYACVRPVKYFEGVPSPMKEPGKLDIVIFRENTEDSYAGVEWMVQSPFSLGIMRLLEYEGYEIKGNAGIGIKFISELATSRIADAAIKYAIGHGRESVTIMHKGNIMKATEGSFRKWVYDVAKKKYSQQTITEEEVWAGKSAAGKVVIKDRIADNMFQQLLLSPEKYDVIVTPNLNGDYLSDAAAAQVGGLGVAPGANINYENGLALFEATHGTAPDIAGKGKANPSSIILSAQMMLEYIGWNEAAKVVMDGFKKTIQQKKLTPDFVGKAEGAEELSTQQFGEEIVKNIEGV